MVGELYQKLGLLSHGRVNHYSRRDLVREGTAAEEQLVRQALKNSIGGILFVDQAGDLFHPEDPNDRGGDRFRNIVRYTDQGKTGSFGYSFRYR